MTDNINVILDHINNPVQFDNSDFTVLQPIITNQQIIVSNQDITVSQVGSDQYTIQFHNVLQLPYVDTRDTEFIYDSNNTLVRVNRSDGTYKIISYNINGTIHTVTNGSNTWSYIYDSGGNLINIQSDI